MTYYTTTSDKGYWASKHRNCQCAFVTLNSCRPSIYYNVRFFSTQATSQIMNAVTLFVRLKGIQRRSRLDSISVATGGGGGNWGQLPPPPPPPPTVIRSTPEIRANLKSLGGGGVGRGIKGKMKVTKVTKIIDSYSCKYILDAHYRGHRDAVMLCNML